jgi:FkbM family methyltransferase
MIIAKILRKSSVFFDRLSKYFGNKKLNENGAKLIRSGLPRSIYETSDNIQLWLGGNSTIDQTIISSGNWEHQTTQLVKRLIKKNDFVIDVGANFGYYATLFAKLVGPEGNVIAFEPTNNYFKLLNENISLNNFKNIEIVKMGLSNIRQDLEISIDDSSATIHQPFKIYVKSKETISLITLDDFVSDRGLSNIDFIKIDVDGHDPFVLEGAIKTIQKFNPIVIMEVSHLHYVEAGITAWDFYEKLQRWGFIIYYESDMEEILTKNDFLAKCGSFSQSYNIIISLKKIEFNKAL